MNDPVHDPAPGTAAGKAARPAPDFAVPGIVFDNRTPYAAMRFDIIDQHETAFHVFVAKIGYTLGPCDANGLATLRELDTPARLNTQDRHDGDDPAASVLEENDFAPYKPACDVIVNAIAHAPQGKPVRQFEVGLSMTQAPPPHGEQQAASALLINKTLTICGARWFKKKRALRRLLQWPLRIITLGLARPNPWRLSAPAPVTQLPLRYEYALGGQCRIARSEPAAKRVARKHQSPEPALAAPTADGAPPAALAHDACQANPLGRGFTRRWFLDATRDAPLPAPQIDASGHPCDARQLWRGANGEPLPAPAGMGPVGRVWLPRRALVGHIEDREQWQPGDIPRLPPDFDFAYWNGAPLDQQCPYPSGRERITLANLCRADEPAARIDRDGNVMLRVELPRQAMFVLAINRANELTMLPLVLDTVTIAPEARRLDLVWRGCLPADGDKIESRLMHITQADQLERLRQVEQHQWSAAATPAGAG